MAEEQINNLAQVLEETLRLYCQSLELSRNCLDSLVRNDLDYIQQAVAAQKEIAIRQLQSVRRLLSCISSIGAALDLKDDKPSLSKLKQRLGPEEAERIGQLAEQLKQAALELQILQQRAAALTYNGLNYTRNLLMQMGMSQSYALSGEPSLAANAPRANLSG